MCGRSRCALAPEEVIARAKTNTWQNRDLYHPSNNVSPGSATPVIHLDKTGQTIIHTMRWGLVPSFTKPTEKPDFWRMFNARSESIQEKPSFRRLVPTRRCIIPLNGFFEWKKEEGGPGGKTKQPYYIYLVNEKDGEEEPMFMAGLWDVWYRGGEAGDDGSQREEGKEGAEDEKDKKSDEKSDKSPKEVMHTYTILTTESCPQLQWLHDRMPVILKDEEAQQMWLNTTDKSSLEKLHSILGPYSGPSLRWRPVSRQMSNPSFQGPEAYQEIKKQSIQNFFQPRGGKKIEHKDKGENIFKTGGDSIVKKEGDEKNSKKKAENKEQGKVKEGEVAPTPNTDEAPPTSPQQLASAAPEANKEKETPAIKTTPKSGWKRQLPVSPSSSPSRPPSTNKKTKVRPPDQPDIASFFSKK